MPKQNAETEPDFIPYTMNLHDGRTLFVRVPARMTARDRDGSITFKPEGMRFIDRIRALAMQTPPAPSPAYIRTVREALAMTQAEFATRLGRSTISIKKYESGDARPGKEVVQKLRQLVDDAGRKGIVLAG